MTTMVWTAENRLTVSNEGETCGEITETGEWWLQATIGVLAMLRGKRNGAGAEYILGPADADPHLIGELVAHKLRDWPS